MKIPDGDRYATKAVLGTWRALEAGQGSTGHPAARQALQQYFTHEQATAPTRAAAFLQGTPADQQRLKADFVSVAQFLLGA